MKKQSIWTGLAGSVQRDLGGMGLAGERMGRDAGRTQLRCVRIRSMGARERMGVSVGSVQRGLAQPECGGMGLGGSVQPERCGMKPVGARERMGLVDGWAHPDGGRSELGVSWMGPGGGRKGLLGFLLAVGLGLAFMLLLPAGTVHAQSRADLEKERAAIQKEIEDVKRSLDETHKNKRETLGQLALLQRRLKLRESAIQNINSQINIIQNDMNDSWREILTLRRELDTLRAQYATSIVFAYKNRSSYDFLNFIFSATSFNDAIKRVEYLKSYRAYREERAENIVRTQAVLQGKIDGLKVTRLAKDEALKKQNKERSILEDEKKEKDAVVNRLKSQEKELKKEMSAKQRQDQKLAGAIAAAIKRARDAAIKESAKRNAAAASAGADKNAASNKGATRPAAGNDAGAPAPGLTVMKSANKTVFESEEDLHLSGNFEKNKGHLPWPVSGTVSMAFGPHEYIKGIIHNNQGVTIDVNAGAAVKAVFEGVVATVFNVGDVSAVIIRHGKYFTTYSNLSTVSVTKGEQVRTGQILGQVGDIGQLEFVLSDEKDHMFDPEKWLRR